MSTGVYERTEWHLERLRSRPSRKGKRGHAQSDLTKSKISETCKSNGVGGWMRGRKHLESTKLKMSISHGKNELSPKWKGDRVGYVGLHIWVSNHLGKPHNCEHCGNAELKHRQYHWANKSGEYKRELSDWIRLCVSCHSKYDHATTA